MKRGYILNVYDALNFDIGFFDDTGIEDVAHQTFEFSSGTGTTATNGKSYRCHLKDVRFKPVAKCHPDYGHAKRILIQWTDYTNGYIDCQIYNVDTYGRLIVELFDPFTEESLKEYITRQFSTIICHYQHSTGSIRLLDYDAERRIARPISFQLPPKKIQ